MHNTSEVITNRPQASHFRNLCRSFSFIVRMSCMALLGGCSESVTPYLFFRFLVSSSSSSSSGTWWGWATLCFSWTSFSAMQTNSRSQNYKTITLWCISFQLLVSFKLGDFIIEFVLSMQRNLKYMHTNLSLAELEAENHGRICISYRIYTDLVVDTSDTPKMKNFEAH